MAAHRAREDRQPQSASDAEGGHGPSGPPRVAWPSCAFGAAQALGIAAKLRHRASLASQLETLASDMQREAEARAAREREQEVSL